MCSYDGVNRVWNTSPVTLSIAAAATERACTSSPTLVRSVNTGASHHCRKDRAGDSLPGNPRTWVSEAPARNPQLNAGGHAYRLVEQIGTPFAGSLQRHLPSPRGDAGVVP